MAVARLTAALLREDADGDLIEIEGRGYARAAVPNFEPVAAKRGQLDLATRIEFPYAEEKWQTASDVGFLFDERLIYSMALTPEASVEKHQNYVYTFNLQTLFDFAQVR